MSQWQIIFLQSKVNNGIYNGEILPAQNWKWPEGTWFQKRLQADRQARTLNLQRHVHDLVLLKRREQLQAADFRRAA